MKLSETLSPNVGSPPARWQWLRTKFQLFAAVLVAAAWTDMTDPAAYRRVRRAFTLWFGAMDKGAGVDYSTFQKRLATCQHCPIFYKPLGTCGSALRKELRDMGCGCHMETAAKLADKGCWMDEALGDEAPYGWKKAGL